MENCIAKMSDEYTFLKSYRIEPEDAREGDVEFSYVFTKDTDYLLTLCSEDGEEAKMKVSVFDSNRNLITSNFYNEKYLGKIGYKCNATGMYYFKFSFAENTEACGVGVIGFKR